MLTADSHDVESLERLAAQTKVVCTTVGPYAKYGSELVGACVRNGTHYCDLAGEVQWMRAMIDRHEEAARASGACVVHACGFDSVPSDLGVYFLQREARERFGAPCSNVKLRVKTMKGGASGGTIASMMNAIEEGRADANVARVLVAPYSLNPRGNARRARRARPGRRGMGRGLRVVDGAVRDGDDQHQGRAPHQRRE